MEFVDTHAHLYVEEFREDRDDILKRALKEGINRIVLPAIDSQTHEAMVRLSNENPGTLFPLMGVHPTSVKEDYKKELALAEKYISQRSLFYGIGEIGIDLYWDKTHVKQQIEAFKTQVNWAIELKLPIVIHTRDSFNEVYAALEPMMTGGLTGIFHCFGGSVDEARKIIGLGFKLGIGGVLTFKNSKLDTVLHQIDLKHLVLETDSPYLAPVPYRGKRNESSYLKLIANKLAEVKGLSIEEVAKITTANANHVFGF